MILMHLKIRNRQKPVIFVLFSENPYELPLPALLSGDRRPQSMKDLGVNNSMFYLSCYKKKIKGQGRSGKPETLVFFSSAVCNFVYFRAFLNAVTRKGN